MNQSWPSKLQGYLLPKSLFEDPEYQKLSFTYGKDLDLVWVDLQYMNDSLKKWPQHICKQYLRRMV